MVFLGSRTQYKPLNASSTNLRESMDELEMPQIDYSVRKKRCGFFRNLWAVYDHTVLTLLFLNFFNNGAMSMVLMIIVNMY